MVDSRFLITFTKPFDRHHRSASPPMADAVTPSAPAGSQLTQQSQRSRKKSVTANLTKRSPCHWSHGAAADVVILMVVLFAFGFLLLPCLQLFYHGLAGVGGTVLSELRDESVDAPMVWLFVVLCFFLLTVAIFIAILCSTSGRVPAKGCCRLRYLLLGERERERRCDSEQGGTATGREGRREGKNEAKGCYKDASLVAVLAEATAAGKAGSELQAIEDEWLAAAQLKTFSDCVKDAIKRLNVGEDEKR